jgi:hypothetical protein
MTLNLPRRLPRFCPVIAAILGQISPETELLFQLLLYGFVAFSRILAIMITPAPGSANPASRRRKQPSFAFHACRHRPRGWQHFYRSAWPIRLRLQTGSCVYCSLWLRTSTLFRMCSSLPTTTTTLFQRVMSWLSGGLACLFDRTRGHPGEGPQEHDNENVRVNMRVVCVFVCGHIFTIVAGFSNDCNSARISHKKTRHWRTSLR